MNTDFLMFFFSFVMDFLFEKENKKQKIFNLDTVNDSSRLKKNPSWKKL